MWCLVMFDLPTQTAEQRRAYTGFRNLLLDCGFVRTQYSVYAKYSPAGVLTQRAVNLIRAGVPPQGEVRLMHVTDIQWASTIRIFNAAVENPEEKPTQLAFF
ncbi:MAG: CRISPR-associated endonuclease Cas2 [Trueperella sp.]|nr:CRISPR-associated endonuclease Cas2 [Trueperella sp.]